MEEVEEVIKVKDVVVVDENSQLESKPTKPTGSSENTLEEIASEASENISQPSTQPLVSDQVEQNEKHSEQLNNLSSVTKSTLVITDSQLLDFNGSNSTDKFVEIEREDESNENQNNIDNLNNLNYLSSNNDSDSNNDSRDDQQNYEYLNKSLSNEANLTNEDVIISKNVIDDVELSKKDEHEIKDKEENTESLKLEKQLSSDFTDLTTHEASKQNDKMENADTNGHISDDYEKEYEITSSESIKEQNGSLSVRLNSKLDEIKNDLDTVEEKITETLMKSAAQSQTPKSAEKEVFEKILGNDTLMKKITQYGIQDEISKSRPVNGQLVTIDYEAFLYEDEKPGKLVDHGENFKFILGDGDVVNALDIVLSLMDKDEKCEVITDARHAYGSIGKTPDIPSNAKLFYKIHLKDFENSIEMENLSPVERLSLAESKKLRGNFFFNRQEFEWATLSYKKGLKYLKEENLKGDEEEVDKKKFSELSQALLMNLALANFKSNECREALSALEQVLVLHDKHIKALYIKGKVLLQLGDTQEAIKSLNASLQLDPNNNEVRKELAKAQAKHKMQYDNEKKMYQKMISGVSKTEEEQNKKLKSSLSKNNKNNNTNEKNDSSLIGYIATGLFLAVASVGVAMLIRYKNLI